MTRHEFLAIMHQVLQPKNYLEIGVQHGHSLRLAKCPAIGIDPHADLGLQASVPNARVFRMSSDQYFREMLPDHHKDRDFVFIDGDHLIEQVCRDFDNIERWCAYSSTVVVLDDVLPYSQAMGSRTPCAGDWSGDAWKVWYLLSNQRSYDMRLVDVHPAGLLVVTGFTRWSPGFPEQPLSANTIMGAATEVPDTVLHRSWAVQPDEAIKWLQEWYEL